MVADRCFLLLDRVESVLFRAYHEGFLPEKNFLVGDQPVFSVISLGFPWRDGPVREGLLRAQELMVRADV